VPAGANFHVAAFDDSGLRVTDLWDTPEDFQAFAGGRLRAAVAAAGITTEPEVEILPVHALFAPAWQPA
jgi:hypothetical protein